MLNLEAHVDATHYASHEDQSTVDYHVSAEGRYDFEDNNTRFSYGLLGLRNHEDANSSNTVGALAPRFTMMRARMRAFRTGFRTSSQGSARR